MPLIPRHRFYLQGIVANTTGVKASIIEGVNVFVAVLVASLLFHQEKLTGKKIIGCLIGFAGVVIVNLGGSMDMGFRLTGEGFIFLSTVAYAFSSVFLKRYSKDENPVLLSGYQFITGGITMCVIGLLMGGKVHGFAAASTGMLVYLAVVSAVAYSLWGSLWLYESGVWSYFIGTSLRGRRAGSRSKKSDRTAARKYWNLCGK